MVGYAQVTNEVEQILDLAGSIHLLNNNSLAREYCAEFDGKLVLLSKEYNEKEKRIETYERMAEIVMDRAQSSTDPVVLAVYGHPLMGVSPSKFILERSREQGLEVQVFPGISSLDCLYADLELDPLQNGLQIFEATDFLLRDFRPNPEIPLLLMQIGLLETGLYSTDRSSTDRFERLQRHLTQDYPSSHELKIIKTATYPITESEQIEFKLNEFGSVSDRVEAAHTLYVPPTRIREIQNESLAEKIDSEIHLDDITE